MRVVINQTTAFGMKAGIGHYTEQLLRCLREQAGTERIDCFPTGWVRSACELYARAKPTLNTGRHDRQAKQHRPERLLVRLKNRVRQHFYEGGQKLIGWHFRSLCAREGFDLYHEPNLIPLPCDLPTVATLHDLSLLHPEWHQAERVSYFERQLPRALAQCRHILTDSDFIRQEVIQVLRVPPERVTRIHIGIRPELGPLPADEVRGVLDELGLPRQFLLYVGTLEPRKNLLPLLRAYCDLPARLRERWPLLLVGRWGWNVRALADYLDSVARHCNVVHLGYIEDRHLPALYNAARALIYPSLYEGFGLPPLEMMACGGAVLASTAGALVETIGKQAHLVPPADIDGWRTAMSRILADDDWWQSLCHGAQAVARPYTWERCAAQTMRVYRSLCGREQPQEYRAAG